MGFDHLLMEIPPNQHGVHPSWSCSSAPNPWTTPQGLRVSAATLGVPTALLLLLSAARGFPSGFPASRLSLLYRNRHLGAGGGPAWTLPAQDEPTCSFVVALRNVMGSGSVLSTTGFYAQMYQYFLMGRNNKKQKKQFMYPYFEKVTQDIWLLLFQDLPVQINERRHFFLRTNFT